MRRREGPPKVQKVEQELKTVGVCVSRLPKKKTPRRGVGPVAAVLCGEGSSGALGDNAISNLGFPPGNYRGGGPEQEGFRALRKYSHAKMTALMYTHEGLLARPS